MNKDIFLRDLGRFLSDIPQAEREQALKYYEDYFEDAGPENEQQVIQELGSPVELAKQMKASSQENIEYGQGTDFHKPSSYPDLYAQKQSQDFYNGSQTYQNTGFYNNGKQTYQNNSTQNAYSGNSYSQGNQQNGQKKSWTQDSGKTALVIILAVLAIPVGIPILSAAFALIISILALIFACFIAVFAIGGGLTIGGIAATVAAFTLFPVYGGASSILVAGIGLILLAVGIIIFWLSIVFCVKFFPAAFHVIIKCCRSIGKGLKSFFH